MNKICYILSLQILIGIILIPSYKADTSAKHLKPVELTNKSSSIKKDKTKKNIKPAISVTTAIGTLVCTFFIIKTKITIYQLIICRTSSEINPFLYP